MFPRNQISIEIPVSFFRVPVANRTQVKNWTFKGLNDKIYSSK